MNLGRKSFGYVLLSIAFLFFLAELACYFEDADVSFYTWSSCNFLIASCGRQLIRQNRNPEIEPHQISNGMRAE